MSESVKTKSAFKQALSKVPRAKEVTIASPVSGERRANRTLIGRAANRPPGTQNLLPILVHPQATTAALQDFTLLYHSLRHTRVPPVLNLVDPVAAGRAGCHGYDPCKLIEARSAGTPKLTWIDRGNLLIRPARAW
jgi:hypothetical protein